MYRKDFRPCSALVISSMRKHSYHAHVKHHTALSIAQHWVSNRLLLFTLHSHRLCELMHIDVATLIGIKFIEKLEDFLVLVLSTHKHSLTIRSNDAERTGSSQS